MLDFHASRPTSICMATDSECYQRSRNGVSVTAVGIFRRDSGRGRCRPAMSSRISPPQLANGRWQRSPRVGGGSDDGVCSLTRRSRRTRREQAGLLGVETMGLPASVGTGYPGRGLPGESVSTDQLTCSLPASEDVTAVTNLLFRLP